MGGSYTAVGHHTEDWAKREKGRSPFEIDGSIADGTHLHMGRPARVTDLSFPALFELALPGYEVGVSRRGGMAQPHVSRAHVRGKEDVTRGCHLLVATRRRTVTPALSVHDRQRHGV